MKRLIIFILAVFLFLQTTSAAVASLVVIDGQGEMIWKVLSLQDEITLGVKKNSLEVKEVAGETDEDQRIAIRRQDGKIYLNELDVTTWPEALVEIEERGDTQKARIGVEGEQFTIEQNGIKALTDYPITVDPRANELSLTTPSGGIFLSVLPLEAVESALRSRFLNRLPEKKIYLQEEEVGTLAYIINGEKVLDVLGVVEYSIPVTAQISASTGEVLNVDGPEWFKIFGFLFS